MAFKRTILFLIFCLASLVSLGLARKSPSISPRPSKGIMECWAASYDLAKCSGELLRVSQGGVLDLSIWPDCCKAAESISSGCWPKMFPMNPLFPQILRMYCPRLSLPPPPPPPMTPDAQGPSMVFAPTDAPTPNADAPTPDADAPTMDADVVKM
ncbi:putative Prolamin-like domain-containing protein [Helianthus annuus]|uniref:Prolamin-like domain-containing protein n=2 Tax=Helianthus annuus TaxID=4232 RepID=A0A251TS48_HELAN|nr:putative Prolamin-like domain-containing protein [Helianthus annuus]KAJ0515300.1 putative Egg cell-secreted protein 1.2/1.3/1.4 [Helianthus annuus]KAJ0523767.1 putative Prolamin-like domain-containing protein [Helianthus annuus]KAJ0531495.1 putative Egg cell-secreted protein 1.2/1.3/1.4 [Helianthus annuus]KAJ0881419.1 putative Prolamin-like domain-containing protein [Helianthus annuus]